MDISLINVIVGALLCCIVGAIATTNWKWEKSNLAEVVKSALIGSIIGGILGLLVGSLRELLLTIFVVLILGYLVNKLAGRDQKAELVKLKEESRKIILIESLDEFAEKVLDHAKNAKSVVLFCIPSPLLFSFQDTKFMESDAESSAWWGRFAGPLIENLTRGDEDAKLDVKLAILNEDSLRKYAKELFSNDDKARGHLLVVKGFIKKLEVCCNLTVERTFNIPSWMFITDYHLEKLATATVGFTDPWKVLQEKSRARLPNKDISYMITGVYTSDKYAVEFFYHSFNDLVTRHYFCEVVEEIKSQLRRNNIDVAYIHKWEKELDALKSWEPSEVILREKRS